MTSEEEERGGEDDYVDPKLFLEDQERIMQVCIRNIMQLKILLGG